MLIPTLGAGVMTDSQELRTLRLDSEAGRALGALIEAKTAADAIISHAVGATLHGDAEVPLPNVSDLAARRDRLTESLVGFAILGGSVSDLAEARRDLEETTASVADSSIEAGSPGGHPPAIESAHARRARQVSEQEDLAYVAASLRETGLERHDVSLHLGTERDGTRVLVWNPVPPETAHVWLLDSFYERIEQALLLDDDLQLERRASEWWFTRWSGEPRGQQERFAYGVREQEWSLVERPMMLLGTSVVGGFRDQPFHGMLRPRQQRLGSSLCTSFASVFVVRERTPDTTAFESLVDGRRYEVHEHNTDIDYAPGHMGFGRIIPFEGRRYLRSPGMLFVPQLDDSRSEDLARMVADGEDGMAPPIGIEMALSVLLGRGKVPRVTPPAASSRDAQELVTALREMMEEHGLAERASIEDAPAEVRESLETGADPHDVEYWRYDVHEVCGEWMQALAQQALKRGGQSGRVKARKRKGRKK